MYYYGIYIGDAEGNGGSQDFHAPTRPMLAFRADRRSARALHTLVSTWAVRGHGGSARHCACRADVHKVRQGLPLHGRAASSYVRMRWRSRLATRSHQQQQEKMQVAAVRQPQPATSPARHEKEHTELANAATTHACGQT